MCNVAAAVVPLIMGLALFVGCVSYQEQVSTPTVAPALTPLPSFFPLAGKKFEPTPEPSPTPVPTPTPLPSPTPEPSPTPVLAHPLPIVDLHFHPQQDWNVAALVRLFDELGVRRAGNGASSADSLHAAFSGRYPDRFFAFAGQMHIRRFLLNEGERAWQLTSPGVVAYLDQLEGELQAGRYQGIGELYANNTSSHPPDFAPTRFPADSPLMQRLWEFSARYGIPLSVHMDAADASVAAMERLLASNRDGTWIWAHTGHYAEPPLLRRLFQTHPNLYCELTWREGHRARWPIDTNGRFRPEWQALLEEFPDRFLVGTDDVGPASLPRYRALIGAWRVRLEQLTIETAAKMAYQNAERLLGRGP